MIFYYIIYLDDLELFELDGVGYSHAGHYSFL